MEARQAHTFFPSGRVISLGNLLASGAFGHVFEATDSNGSEFVLKRVQARSKQDGMNVQSEIAILGSFAELNINVPKIIDYMLDENNSCYLILMTREPGISLDEFMQCSIFSFADRLAIAELVLDSLAPTCKVLETLCCHRDLNSHNILIAIDPLGTTRLTIVDFGFAIEANAWWHYRWRDSPVAGDARYWPCCAWSMLISGWRNLKGEDQYKEKLDMHSFAITLLEVVFRDLELVPSLEIENLRMAFDKYWKEACQFSDIFVNCCRADGDMDSTRKLLSNLDVVGKTRENLQSMKNALKVLRHSNRLFPIVERMICVDESTVTGTWSYVCSKSVRVHY